MGYKTEMIFSEEVKATVGKALGRIPSGLFVLTASHGGKRDVMLASWVQQASFDPPAISIAIARDRPIIDLIKTGKMLGISIIPEGDTSLMKRYARGVKAGEDPFAGVETLTTPGGAIVLKQSLAWMEGHFLQQLDYAADHVILIAQITAGAVEHSGPSFVHLRGSGFHY